MIHLTARGRFGYVLKETDIRFLRISFILLLLFCNTVFSQANDDEYIEKEYLIKDSLIDLKKYGDALEVLNKLDDYILQKYGQASAHYADQLSFKGEIYNYIKKFDLAVESFNQALEIRRTIPDEKEGCFILLNNLGYVYREMGLYTKSEAAMLEAEQIYRDLHGDGAPNLAIVLSNLGGLYKDMALFEKSEEVYLEAMRINEINYGPEPMQNAIIYNNLGGLYRNMGNLKLTEFYYVKLYDLLLNKVGPNHPKFGSALSNLAVLYSDIGDYKKAETWQLKGIEKGVSADTASYIANCINLASTYAHLSEFQKAQEYLWTAINLQHIFLPENHRDLSRSYSILGNLYSDMEDYESAEKYLNIALEKYAITHGVNSHDYGYVMISLAFVSYHLHDYAVAYEQSKKGLQLVMSSVGMRHSLYPNMLRRTASICQKTNHIDEAEQLYLEFVEVQYQLIKQQFTFLSEVEKESYLNKVMDGFDEFCTFALFRKAKNPGIVGEVYNLVLNTKGILLKSSTLVRKLILESKDQELVDKYETWISLKKKITNLHNQPIEKRKEDPALLEEKAALLEKEFTAQVIDFSSMQEVMNESWTNLQEGLGKNEALIEFMHFRTSADSMLYCALVLKYDSEYPVMIPLFEEKELQKVLTDKTNNQSINELYGTKLKKNSALYNIIWKPLESSLQNIRKVHVSASGQLHKISFACLSKDDGSYLIDLVDLNMMATTAYFNHDASFIPTENTSISLFGGIQYSSDSSSAYPWQYLSGSKAETDALARSFKKYSGAINYLTGSEATKMNFVNIASKSNILHIATHGFFFPDPLELMVDIVDSTEHGDIKFRGTNAGRATDLYVNSQNPLMRSGLVFAGANDYWNGLQDDENDNGIITALDVINLNLNSTKLVVLSACESGLGDIVDGEGVYGLQRAFKMAGTDFIIMSLWQVPDKETAEFMEIFYGFLYKKNDIREAFALTQQTMREKYDPYYWGAFVLIE